LFWKGKQLFLLRKMTAMHFKRGVVFSASSLKTDHCWPEMIHSALRDKKEQGKIGR